MPEQLSQGLSPEDKEIAKTLYGMHEYHGKSLENALAVNERADEARQMVAEANSNGAGDDVPYETRAFANGKFTQRQILDQAQLFYDSNLWRAHQHKVRHLDEYIQQAKNEAIEAGVIINTDSVTTASKVVHGAENFSVSESAEAIPETERVALTKEDLRVPEIFEPGDELIILACNVKDIRAQEDGEIGTLYPEQADAFRNSIVDLTDSIYEHLSEEEKENLDIVVLAGDTTLVTPGNEGLKVSQQRAVLTGKEAIAGITQSMEKYGIDASKHIISDGEKPVALSHLRDVNMLHETDNPNVKQFVDYMIDKYGSGRELWMAFEDDSEKEQRESLGVEGPTEIADRVAQLVNLAAYIADLTKQGDKDKRVVVLAVGHYDNISPWAKKNLLGINPADGFIPVEKGGGLVIQRKTNGSASTLVGGKEYLLDIEV
jgi:cobalamin biosynthesis Mg chelatase CobN